MTVSDWLPVIGVVAAAVVGLAVLMALRADERSARFVLWIGVLAPILYNVPKTTTEVQAGPSALDAAKGVPPLACLAGAYLLHRAESPAPTRNKLAVLGLVAYLAVNVASAQWSLDRTSTLLRAGALIFGYACLWALARRSTTETLICNVATFVAVCIAWAPFDFLITQVLVPSLNTLLEAGRLGTNYPLISPDPFGYVAVLGLLAAVLGVGPRWAVGGEGRRLLFGVVATVELAATQTRTALVLGLVVLLYVLARAMRRSPWAIQGFLALVFAGIAAVGFGGSKVTAVLSRGQNANQLATLTGRLDYWTLGLHAWRAHRWLGQGYYAGHRLGLPAPPGKRVQSNIDNTWLETLVDTGIVGTSALALFVLGGLWAALRLRGRIAWQYHAFLVAGIVYGVVISFVNPSIQDTTASLLMLGGLLFAAVFTRTDGEAQAVGLVVPRSAVVRTPVVDTVARQ